MKNLIIIIPTFNEEKNILKLTNSIHKFIPSCKILIIDDTKNSQIHKVYKNKGRINFIIRKNKKGRGSAVLFGLKNALRVKNNKIFIEMDADFSHKPGELNRNINFFLKNNCDLLIASRYLPKSKIHNWGVQRRIFSKKAVKTIVNDCGNIGDGFIVLSEILLKIHQSKLKIMEIHSTFKNRERGESAVNLYLILQSFFGLIKLFLIKMTKK